LRITRANLAVVGTASTDKREPALNRVHISADGATVAGNGSMLMAVGPADPERMKGFPETDPGINPPEDGVGVSLNTISDTKRNLPAEKLQAIQQVQITRCDTRVELLTSNGATAKRVATAPMRGKFPRWQRIFAEARAKAKKTRICVNRRELMRVLKAMDEACPDRGEFCPVYLELGDENDLVVLRGQNYGTKQHVVSTLRPILPQEWLPTDAWERGVYGEEEPKPRGKPKARPKGRKKGDVV